MNQMIFNSIIEEVTEGIYNDNPVLLEKFGERGRQKCREDNEHHIKYLQTAAALDDEKYFTDYAIWLNGILTSRGMQTAHLVDNFERLKNAFEKVNGEEQSREFINMLNIAIGSLTNAEKQ